MIGVFIGDTTLVIRCAEHFLSRGHTIGCVISSDKGVVSWAQKAGIPSFDSVRNIKSSSQLAELSCDIMFSVSNLNIIPPRILKVARTYAINFHDGPLPGYAGLNATSWALLNHEREHEVTWHIMEEKPDAGSVLVKQAFDIETNETAASLNAKCYEAGFESFCLLIDQIEKDTLVFLRQTGVGSYFSKHLRPPDCGLLDFTKTAEEVCTVVRALDSGPFANPLGPAKIMINDRILCVDRVAIKAQGGSDHSPGKIIEDSDDGLIIACRTGAVWLGGLSWPNGEDVDKPALKELARERNVRLLDDPARRRLRHWLPKIAKSEDFWMARLQTASALALPYPETVADTEAAAGEWYWLPLRASTAMAPVGAPLCLAALASWIQQLSGEPSITVRYFDDIIASELCGIEPLIQSWRPARLDVDGTCCLADLLEHSTTELSLIECHAPPPIDLAMRLSNVSRKETPPVSPKVGVVKCWPAAPAIIGDGSLDLLLICGPADSAKIGVNTRRYTAHIAHHIAQHFQTWLARLSSAPKCQIQHLSLVPDAEADTFHKINLQAATSPSEKVRQASTILSSIRDQMRRTPDRVALRQAKRAVTFDELDRRSDLIASTLQARGIGRGDFIGVCLPHDPDMVSVLLGILKVGAAYVPLDPSCPKERLIFMLRDSGTKLVFVSPSSHLHLKNQACETIEIDTILNYEQQHYEQRLPIKLEKFSSVEVSSEDSAYLIYTSGSTGQPKGVRVTHANVANFFDGMNRRIRVKSQAEPGVWLSVTTINFDISVLELLWTLTRGFTVVLSRHGSTTRRPIDKPAIEQPAPSFSLFYFASNTDEIDQDPYRLLLEGARFADNEGLEAVWTPERHFHSFGGFFPNPVVTASAIAATTKRVHIRAGSCIAPLHHPVRIAEDWAVVDNLSNGRVGIAFASGWNPNDFVLHPEAFADAKELTFEVAAQVATLWRGDTLALKNGKGDVIETRTLPRPVQKTLPTWITAASSSKTFEMAGAEGYNVLTHLLGMSLEQVAENIEIYRKARRLSGYSDTGKVTLMLHTFVGDDVETVRNIVREPMKRYLSNALDLIKGAAWSFPTFQNTPVNDPPSMSNNFDKQDLTTEEREAVLEHAFNRYFEDASLFGTTSTCRDMVERARAVGVDEIACLIDFGVEADLVVQGLSGLKALTQSFHQESNLSADRCSYVALSEEIIEWNVTHLQCTPSMANVILAEPESNAALSKLHGLLIGGEPLSAALARRLRSSTSGQLLNMYGPTETTIWSTVAELENIEEGVQIGSPIVNTELRVMSPSGADCPAMAAGELWIAGAGVSKGYWKRKKLNEERFIHKDGLVFYRTGDIVRRDRTGRIEFLGRLDSQVKIRGHRIELREIETQLEDIPGINRAVARVIKVSSEACQLQAYVSTEQGAHPDSQIILGRLRKRLPDIMVPQVLKFLDEFPLTPHGKIDIKALPEPTVGHVRAPAPKSNEIEQIIAAIWCRLIGLDSVSTRENFFDVGGHSLLAVYAQRQINEELNASLSITDVFRYPTIQQLARRINKTDRSGPSEASKRGANRASKRLKIAKSQRTSV